MDDEIFDDEVLAISRETKWRKERLKAFKDWLNSRGIRETFRSVEDLRGRVETALRKWNQRRAGTRIPGAGDIFISYSQADYPAARVLVEELAQIGAGIIFSDKSLLKPDDEWENEILAALKRGALFLPLLSSNTEQRDDGFFRMEWYEAVKRSQMIQGRRFIFPVVVDPEFDGNASRYRLVPDQFHSFQFGHAPGGHMSDDLRRAITEALRDLRRPRAT